MRIAEVDFPDDIIRSIDEGRLVVFAGAGVSRGRPANMPNFKQLATRIAKGTGKRPRRSEPIDRFLGELKSTGVNVESLARQEFVGRKPKPTALHRQILRLFVRPDRVRIVTTNFDRLFEDAARHERMDDVQMYSAPALPSAKDFRGIAHIHGTFDSPAGVVLTDEDFGRAYLTEGHTSRFLVDLFREFDVLFVGYSHDDIVMTYLARALSDTEDKKRFALTQQSNVSTWRHLGIESITYENPDRKHRMLSHSVTGLADILSRTSSDWQNRIHDLVQQTPADLCEQALGEITYALTDPIRTRFFTEAATDSGWVGWLDDRRYLDAMFTQEGLGERDEILVRWLAHRFACSESDLIMKTIGKYGARIGPVLWLNLAGAVVRDLDEALSDNHHRKWVSLLLATMPVPQRYDLVGTYMKLMAGKSIQRGQYDLAVKVFHAFAAGRIAPSPNLGIAGETMAPEILGDHYQLNAIWNEHLKPSLGNVAEDLLSYLYDRLSRRHEEIQAWQSMSGGLDTDSVFRSSVERDDSDFLQESIDALIEAARDCLVYVAEQNLECAAPWFELFIRSKVPLLRRIVIHALPQRTDLTADEKADWLLAKIDLDALAERHEALETVKAIYCDTSPEARQRIVDAILALEDDEIGQASDG